MKLFVSKKLRMNLLTATKKEKIVNCDFLFFVIYFLVAYVSNQPITEIEALIMLDAVFKYSSKRLIKKSNHRKKVYILVNFLTCQRPTDNVLIFNKM
jgi:hypothetical protein